MVCERNSLCFGFGSTTFPAAKHASSHATVITSTPPSLIAAAYRKLVFACSVAMMCMVPECRSSECVPPLALSCSASLFFTAVQTRAASSLMPAPAMINMTSSAEQAWLSLTTCLVSETVRCSGRRALLISSTPGPFFCRFGKGCL